MEEDGYEEKYNKYKDHKEKGHKEKVSTEDAEKLILIIETIINGGDIINT